MLAKDAVIYWTPNHEKYGHDPLRGQVEVRSVQSLESVARYAYTHGDLDLDWQEADNDKRADMLEENIRVMVVEHGISESAVKHAMAAIEDIDVAPLIHKARS
ncbi:hypothetical protein [Pararhizobium haloflavum]|uniref:hypothetical protein n=1 Tax=Pararhizobium haloflavum TaxID=2037914 RepID=UPI000C17ACB8|nr:hypothetical protein [Pararhizobium haloflavum]